MHRVGNCVVAGPSELVEARGRWRWPIAASTVQAAGAGSGHGRGLAPASGFESAAQACGDASQWNLIGEDHSKRGADRASTIPLIVRIVDYAIERGRGSPDAYWLLAAILKE